MWFVFVLVDFFLLMIIVAFELFCIVYFWENQKAASSYLGSG